MILRNERKFPILFFKRSVVKGQDHSFFKDLTGVFCTVGGTLVHLYGDVTNTGEGLQNLGLCSALRAFEQGGIFIVPHLL
jgi:hypothetical protein